MQCNNNAGIDLFASKKSLYYVALPCDATQQYCVTVTQFCGLALGLAKVYKTTDRITKDRTRLYLCDAT